MKAFEFDARLIERHYARRRQSHAEISKFCS